MNQSGRTRRVVIVDRSRTIQAILEQAFEDQPGFQVVGVADSTERAIELGRNLAPDVITIGPCMPHVNVHEVLSAFGGSRHVCPVVISDLVASDAALKNELTMLGAAACVPKALLSRDRGEFFAVLSAGWEPAVERAEPRAAPSVRPEPAAAYSVAEIADDAVEMAFTYPVTPHETQRVTMLHDMHLANLIRERCLDSVTSYIAQMTDFPFCLMTFVGSDTVWAKSAYGTSPMKAPRGETFCTHTIMQRDPLIVSDTLKDERFARLPSVRNGWKARSYIGYPIVARNDVPIGALCLLDQKARAATKTTLQQLAGMTDIVAEIVKCRGYV